MAIQTIQVERTTETPSQNPNVNPLTLMDMVQAQHPNHVQNVSITHDETSVYISFDDAIIPVSAVQNFIADNASSAASTYEQREAERHAARDDLVADKIDLAITQLETMKSDIVADDATIAGATFNMAQAKVVLTSNNQRVNDLIVMFQKLLRYTKHQVGE